MSKGRNLNILFIVKLSKANVLINEQKNASAFTEAFVEIYLYGNYPK